MPSEIVADTISGLAIVMSLGNLIFMRRAVRQARTRRSK